MTLIKKWKCNGCNGVHPCWMMIEFADINPVMDDHPIDKKLLKRCIMDRKAEADFILNYAGVKYAGVG